MIIDNINICEEGDEQLFSTEYELFAVKVKKDHQRNDRIS